MSTVTNHNPPNLDDNRHVVLDEPSRMRGPMLGEWLINENLITEAELEAAIQLQSQKGRRIGETLIELGIIEEDQLLPFIGDQLGIKAVRLRDGLVDPEAVRLLPQPLSLRLNVLALFAVRNKLVVAMAEPQNLDQIDEIQRVSGLKVKPVFSFESAIQKMSRRCYEEDFSVDTVTADLDETAVELNESLEESDTADIENLVEGSPIINLVNYLILQAMRKGAE